MAENILKPVMRTNQENFCGVMFLIPTLSSHLYGMYFFERLYKLLSIFTTNYQNIPDYSSKIQNPVFFASKWYNLKIAKNYLSRRR